MPTLVKCLFIVLTFQLTTACHSTSLNHEHESIYDQIGGEEGLTKLVDTFIKKIGTDSTILPYFAKSSVQHFKQGFIAHMCEITNGPCQYKGDTMVDIHTGMNINEADFNRVVELLVEAMEDNHINYRNQNKILAKLAPLRLSLIHI